MDEGHKTHSQGTEASHSGEHYCVTSFASEGYVPIPHALQAGLAREGHSPPPAQTPHHRTGGFPTNAHSLHAACTWGSKRTVEGDPSVNPESHTPHWCECRARRQAGLTVREQPLWAHRDYLLYPATLAFSGPGFGKTVPSPLHLDPGTRAGLAPYSISPETCP
jgi:hypothetical protein